MSWRLSMPTLSQPRRRSMFLLHHGLLISCDLLLCRGGHPLHQLHPGGLHVHSLHNGHMILHGDHHRFTATAPWAMVSSSAPQSKPTIAPQSKPANAPRMLSSLPLFPSLSHYFTAQVCYRSIAQVNSVMIQAHITVMYTTKLPWVRFKSSKLAYSAHILQSDCTSSDDDTVVSLLDSQMTTQGRGWMIAIRKVIACPFQIIDLVFSDLSPSIFDAHFCRVTMECVSPGQVAIPPQHSLTD